MAYKIISLCREIIEYELYMNKEKSIDEILEDSLNFAKEANLKSGQIIQGHMGFGNRLSQLSPHLKSETQLIFWNG